MAGRGGVSGMGNGLYTPEQVEILEHVYHECQNSSQSQRLEMINEYPYLSTLESKQIKLWFLNRRRLENEKKKEVEVMALKAKLAATQQLLLLENDRLRQELSQLEDEHEFIQLLMQNAFSNATDKSCESACNPHPLETADNSTGNLSLAEESCTELLTVAKQSTIGRFPTPRMKALHCIVQLVERKSGKLTPPLNKEALLLSFSQRLIGGLNGLNGDGRSLMNFGATETLFMAMNSNTEFGTISSFTAAVSFPGTILCVKVSLLLKEMGKSNFKIATDEEIDVAQSVDESKDMAIATRTKNLEDNNDVQCLMAQVAPGSTETLILADWICKSFRSNTGGIFLKSNGQGQESLWKRCGTSSFRVVLFYRLNLPVGDSLGHAKGSFPKCLN